MRESSNETIGIFDAKTHLSSIIEQVLQGKRFTITRHGKAVAQICPVENDHPKAKRGAARSGDFYIAPDFDETPDDFAEYCR